MTNATSVASNVATAAGGEKAAGVLNAVGDNAGGALTAGLDGNFGAMT